MTTNEELVIRIQSGEDVGNNMALLYGQVKTLFRSIAWRYRDSGEMEDLEQEGYLALYPAIDNFDPDAGCKFLTYTLDPAGNAALSAEQRRLCALQCIAWNRFRRCEISSQILPENTVVMRQMPRFAALWVLPLNRSRTSGKTPV